MTLDEPIEKLAAERSEIDTLIEKGMVISVPKRSVLKYFSKQKDRTFILRQPYLGTLDILAGYYIRIGFSEQSLTEDPFNESKVMMHQNSRICARIVAIALLNSSWKIRFLSPFLARYLLWHVTPKKLFQLTLIVNQIANIGDFINAIRYLSATPRTTDPNLIAAKRD